MEESRALVMSLRPAQWVKNAVLLVPLLFTLDTALDAGGYELVISRAGRSLAGLGLLCALSSAVYLLNDISDRHRDRLHPQKRSRPIASGALPVRTAVAALISVTVFSVAASWILDTGFFLVASSYLLLNLAYSLYLKKLVLVDILAVSLGYVLRLAAGSVLLDVATSPWLYSTLGVGALMIVVGKRLAELETGPQSVIEQRPVLADYTPAFLRQILTISTACTLAAYGIYLFVADNLPPNHTMFLTLPFVVFGLFRYLHIIDSRKEGENPEVIFFKDRPLLLNNLLWASSVIAVLSLAPDGLPVAPQ